MKGLPPLSMPLRVAYQGDPLVLEALSHDTDHLILSPVETSLEISARVTQADVVVVDLSPNPLRALAEIRDLTFDRPILALVAPGQEAQAIAAGAAGVIRKDNKPRAIAAAIAAVHSGLAVFDARYVEASGLARPPAASPQVPLMATSKGANDVLTPRESEVLTLLAEGLSNKEIGVRLVISEHTAKFHVNSILQKMGAQKRVEAVVRAAKLGIIQL